MSSWRMWFVKEQENQTIRQKVQGENFSREWRQFVEFTLHSAEYEDNLLNFKRKLKVGKLSAGRRALYKK